MERDRGRTGRREREWKSGRDESYREWRTLVQKTLSAQSARYFSLLMNPAGGVPLEKHFYFCRSVYRQADRQTDRQTDRQFTMAVLGWLRHGFFSARGTGKVAAVSVKERVLNETAGIFTGSMMRLSSRRSLISIEMVKFQKEPSMTLFNSWGPSMPRIEWGNTMTILLVTSFFLSTINYRWHKRLYLHLCNNCFSSRSICGLFSFGL